MSKLFIENSLKIYFKDSDKARLADVRIRIVRESDPREPCDNEDLVFEKAEDESLIPTDALYKWKFDCNHEHEPIWFFTTAERCMQMVADDPSYWTQEKLEKFAEYEKQLYQDWWDGNVYGLVTEKWDDKRREWVHKYSVWGIYGSDVLYNIIDERGGKDIIVCIDSEDMKYDFGDVHMKVEKQPNEF